VVWYGTHFLIKLWMLCPSVFGDDHASLYTSLNNEDNI
jgi:hypothetical protein